MIPGRVIGAITLHGQKINAEMVKQGWAWVYIAYAKDLTLGDLEVSARASKKGLWQEANPTPPWEWRKQQKKQ